MAIKCPKTETVSYVQLYAALSGLESAVYGCGRFSAFQQAMIRRMCGLLWSMHVDDGDLIDLADAKGKGVS